LILFNIYLAQTLGNLVYNRANYGLAAIINRDINNLFHRFVEYKSKCLYTRGKIEIHTNSLSSANFVVFVVGFLNVCKIRLFASSLPPRYPLKSN